MYLTTRAGKDWVWIITPISSCFRFIIVLISVSIIQQKSKEIQNVQYASTVCAQIILALRALFPSDHFFFFFPPPGFTSKCNPLGYDRP